ncbi:hypothetical protein SDC9_157793 [bioreactor metagenome]|uniref:Uncharacterized protein n=1 Tax=bioreactor metagenome TaxID=1076179 RepID=A0A645F815_9ZZZZ
MQVLRQFKLLQNGEMPVTSPAFIHNLRLDLRHKIDGFIADNID